MKYKDVPLVIKLEMSGDRFRTIYFSLNFTLSPFSFKTFFPFITFSLFSLTQSTTWDLPTYFFGNMIVYLCFRIHFKATYIDLPFHYLQKVNDLKV